MKKIMKLVKVLVGSIITISIGILSIGILLTNDKIPSNSLKEDLQDRTQKKTFTFQNDFNETDFFPIITSTTTYVLVACHIIFDYYTHFMRYLTAYDYEDGDITDKIFISKNENEENLGKLGKFIIEFSVYDSNGNMASIDITIETFDKIPPEIIGPKEIRTYRALKDEEIISLFTSVDNIDEDNVPKIEVISNTLVDNVPGKYYIILKVTDTSNNSNTFCVDYELLEKEFGDGQIVGTIKTDTEKNLSTMDVFNYLIAIEAVSLYDVDTKITSDYFGNESLEGTYEVYVMTRDKLGIYKEFILLIEVSNIKLTPQIPNQIENKKANNMVIYSIIGSVLLVGIIILKAKKKNEQK